MSPDKSTYDVAVIGGGPAGMMAAGRAAELGAKVVLIEKKPRPGTKLLMTGGGRCNLTHAESDTRKLVESYGKNGRFLFSAFSAFGVAETMRFFESHGLKLKTEPDGRVFPASDRAADVLGVLSGYLSSGGVKVLTKTHVTGIEAEAGGIIRIDTETGAISAGHYIICTGGKSYPATGSTGEGYWWIKRLGHTITPLVPLLAPIYLRDKWLKRAEGASVRDAALYMRLDGKMKAAETGEAVFMRDGISGPMALNMSRHIASLPETPRPVIALDLRPQQGMEEIDRELTGLFADSPNMLIDNCIRRVVSPKLAPVYLELAGIDPCKRSNMVTRDERRRLVRLIKGLDMSVAGLGGFSRAMVTGGGASLKEIDQKTMRSKLVSNLSIAGELLDLDGPTGGYNLQMCWSTGYIAGERWKGSR